MQKAKLTKLKVLLECIGLKILTCNTNYDEATYYNNCYTTDSYRAYNR